jgi:glycosyltransferase involved in cell wall biosynthesis
MKSRLLLINLKQVSVVVTVKNEVNQIEHLLNSLLSQTYPPYEIIIVDGGSSDGTVERVRKYEKQGTQIKLIISPGSNIAQGRNIGISNSSADYIACTDAGAVPDRAWLENLVKGFDDKADVVSGVYLPLRSNAFEECVAELLCPKIEDIDESFLPSSRSIAFKKSAWVKVGGYPEDTKYAEDTLFDVKLRERNQKFALAKDAVVYWKLSSHLSSLFLQYFRYAYHETKSGLTSQTRNYRVSQITHPVIHYFSSVRKVYKRTLKPRSILMSLLILPTFFSSLLTGSLLGFASQLPMRLKSGVFR